MKDFCAFCEHYLGGGDFGTCCSVQNGLCYGYDYACEHFKEDYLRKQAFRTGILLYKEALKNQKTQTNAQSVVRGKWIKTASLAPFEDDKFECSECGSWPWWCGVTDANLPNFCPNCGALMYNKE